MIVFRKLNLRWMWLLHVVVTSPALIAQEIDPESFLEAAFVNSQAIHSYDVRVVEECSLFPQPKDKKVFAGSDVTREYRVMMDHTRQLAFYCFRERVKNSPITVREIHAFAGGDSFTNSRKYPTSTFEGFLGNAKFPLIEFAGFGFPYTTKGEALKEHVRLRLKDFTDRRWSRSPDGSITFIKKWGPNEMYTSSVTFDQVNLIPRRSALKSVEDDDEKISSRMFYEEKDGIFRVVQIDTDREELVDVGEGKTITVKSIGTTTFEWLKFNVDDIEFPKRGSLERHSRVIDPYLEKVSADSK